MNHCSITRNTKKLQLLKNHLELWIISNHCEPERTRRRYDSLRTTVNHLELPLLRTTSKHPEPQTTNRHEPSLTLINLFFRWWTFKKFNSFTQFIHHSFTHSLTNFPHHAHSSTLKINFLNCTHSHTLSLFQSLTIFLSPPEHSWGRHRCVERLQEERCEYSH